MNLFSCYLNLFIEEQQNYPIEKIHWIRMSEHYKISNNIGLNHGGAIYGFVFNETQPSQNNLPSDFEECIYVGKSGKGFYYDRKNGLNKKPKKSSYLNKRLIHHRDRFNGTATVSSEESKKYSLFEHKYGFGLDVMNGTLTGVPLWVGLIPVPLNLPETFHENWLLRYERFELFKYKKNFGKSPLLNLDEDISRKVSNSFSNNYKVMDLTSFMK
jgi:hypothetical protein